MTRRISLRHLRCFVAVAEAGSFTVASSRLFLTQSSLTTTIQQFEDAVGLKLFDRTTRRVAMTREAHRFKLEADRILHQFDNAIDDLKAFSEGRRGQIRIAAPASVIEHFLVDAIREFRVLYPDIGISLRDAGAQLVESKLIEGDVDFAVTSRHKGFDELAYTPLFSDRYGIISGEPIAGGGEGAPMAWSDLDAASYIGFTPDTGIGSFLRAHAPDPELFNDSRDEVSSTTSLYPLLAIGGRYAILPALSAATEQFSAFHFRLLDGPALSREMCLITRRLRALTPIARSFLEFLQTDIRTTALPAGVFSSM